MLFLSFSKSTAIQPMPEPNAKGGTSLPSASSNPPSPFPIFFRVGFAVSVSSVVETEGGRLRGPCEVAGALHAGREDRAPEDVRGDLAADLLAAEGCRQEFLHALDVFGFHVSRGDAGVLRAPRSARWPCRPDRPGRVPDRPSPTRGRIRPCGACRRARALPCRIPSATR